MLRSLSTAATGMDAQETRMDVIAHNLANASTAGFKRLRPEFEDLLVESRQGTAGLDDRGASGATPPEVGLGVRTVATTRSLAQGELSNTGNPLDLAIEGQGAFRVRRADGEAAYTRAGNFRLDATGRLVTQSGEVVEPGITFPPDATQLVVRPDGTVLAKVPGRDGPVELGALELAMFPNPGGLASVGHNLLAETAASGAAVRARPGEQGAGALSQGFLEGSNVRAVEEMVDLIATQRAYELNSRVIQTADQMLNRLTSLR